MPPDRDGDGIPDQYDKCPDVPEDKDGIDDGDGCPEDDADNDGIPDAQDACPKEPGQKNTDPKKNGCPTFIKVEGNVVRILQQVHFATGSATILPESFPMLQEIANLLKANKGIKRMSIEGHTDNRGSADLNKKLSARSRRIGRDLARPARRRAEPPRVARLRSREADRDERHRRGPRREPPRRVQDPRRRRLEQVKK